MGDRTTRIMYIDQAIRSGAYPTARTLAQELEVSERTIYADRNHMVNEMEAPIAFDELAGGWYYTDRTWAMPTAIVTEREFLALLVSADLARHTLGTAFEAPLRSALGKIVAHLPDDVRVDLDALAHQYSFPTAATVHVQAQLLYDLSRALTQRCRVRMTYYTASRDERRERLVDPYGLCNNRGDWYLIAHDHWREEVRVFLVGRIEDWRVTGDHFRRDPHFSVDEYLKSGFATERGGDVADVAIRFDAHQARWIRERQWHPTQWIEEQSDGGLILRLRTGGLPEVKRWVLSHGVHAEVLAPDSLRREVAAEAQHMRDIYAH